MSESVVKLVIAAHPDDEVLGCGGTIARSAQDGDEIYIAILGEGITSRNQSEDVEEKLLNQLHTCSQRAAELLGAKDLFLYRLPDNCFDSIPLLNIVKIIEGLVERIRPQVIYTQHGGDLNIDHTIVYRATLTATRPLAGCLIKDIYAYEVPSSTEWAFGRFEPSFQPNVFVDISETLEKKIQAMELYESERRVFPHPRSPEALKAIGQRWGSVVGKYYAEPFELVRSVR